MTEGSKLRWLCRRGMKELDVVLTRYLESSYPSADKQQQKAFRQLLEMQDPTIYGLLLGRESSNDPHISSLIKVIANAE